MQYLSLLLILVSAVQAANQKPFLAPPSIDARYKSVGKKYFGTCTDQELLSRGNNAAIIAADFGQVTPENSMKWQPINPNRGQYNWGGPDYLVGWATNHSKLIRGHTLVWHSQLPGWVNSVNDKAQLTNVIQTHIATVMGRWRGKIYAWDVVNEILAENNNLRPSVFSRVLGDSFVDIAFKAARAADPHAKLYINDYNLDDPNYAKTKAMASRVRQWKAREVPIDGIGSQSHLKPGQAAKVYAALSMLCAEVSECAITELDIEGSNANEFATVSRACLDVRNCVGITMWGVRDSDSWRKERRPLLFDDSYNPKPGYMAILNGIGGR